MDIFSIALGVVGGSLTVSGLAAVHLWRVEKGWRRDLDEARECAERLRERLADTGRKLLRARVGYDTTVAERDRARREAATAVGDLSRSNFRLYKLLADGYVKNAKGHWVHARSAPPFPMTGADERDFAAFLTRGQPGVVTNARHD